MNLVRYAASVILCVVVGLESCRVGKLDEIRRPEIEENMMYNGPFGERKGSLYRGNIAKLDDMRAPNFFYSGADTRKGK